MLKFFGMYDGQKELSRAGLSRGYSIDEGIGKYWLGGVTAWNVILCILHVGVVLLTTSPTEVNNGRLLYPTYMDRFHSEKFKINKGLGWLVVPPDCIADVLVQSAKSKTGRAALRRFQNRDMNIINL